MTITRQQGEYVLVCDNCGEPPDGEEGNTFASFEDARQFAQDNGWRLYKNRSGVWENICPECPS